MIKKIYIVLIILLVVFSFVSIVRATDIDMNMEENTVTDTAADETANTSQQSSSPLSALSSLPEAGLGLGNIINILLITVGVILIFLAIAILVKIK